MLLPRGITGFGVPKGIVESDPKQFREDCEGISKSLRGRIIECEPILKGSITNFLYQQIILPDRAIAILLNRYYPVIGFCEPVPTGNCSLSFVNEERLAKAFEQLGRYQILSAEELNQVLSKDLATQLGTNEWKQIQYWGKLGSGPPLRIGEVLFNFWD